MSYLPTDYDEILKRQQEAVASKKAEREGAINTLYDSQKTVTQDEHNRLIDSIEKDYADEYQKNAVQKLINERQIAETNENLGLTDSGLNRTQQTAAQLSYANQKGKLDIAKQTRLDEQSSALAAAIAQIENNRLAALDENATYWQGVADKNAQAEYEANVEYNAAIDTALIEAAQKSAESSATENSFVKAIYMGEDTENKNKNVFKIGNKTYTYDKGVNPYTGTVNSDTKYGTFKNGYQPDNVGGDKLKDSGEKVVVNGIEQRVWEDTKGNLWKWDGTKNKYEKYGYKPKSSNATNSFIANNYTKSEYMRRGKTLNEWKNYIKGKLEENEENFSDSELDYLIRYYGLRT